MKQIIISLINFYQTFLSFDKGMLSFLVPGGACKFEISCSEYAKQSIIKHGIFEGLIMGIKRIWSCR